MPKFLLTFNCLKAFLEDLISLLKVSSCECLPNKFLINIVELQLILEIFTEWLVNLSAKFLTGPLFDKFSEWVSKLVGELTSVIDELERINPMFAYKDKNIPPLRLRKLNFGFVGKS